MKTFSDVVGHEKIIKHLENAVAKRKPSHAYIFYGEDGVGKRTVAEIFAKSLLCEGDGEKPCGTCKSCMQFESKNHPDVIRVTHEKTMISVDDIRKQLVGEMQIKPYCSEYKIFIIDEAEKLNEAAQNALLKTFEEPPEYGVIILLSNNINALLQTIRSRAVAIGFMPARTEDIVEFLAREKHIPNYQAEMAAACAGGLVGLAYTWADSEEFAERRDLALEVLRKIGRLELEKAISYSKEWAKSKENGFIDFFLSTLRTYIRDILYMKSTGSAKGLMYKGEEQNIKEKAREISFDKLSKILEEAELLKDRMKANVNTEMALQDFMLNLVK